MISARIVLSFRSQANRSAFPSPRSFDVYGRASSRSDESSGLALPIAILA